MLTSLLLLSHLANAGSEVGSVKKLGVGVTTGDPYVGVTGKYWVSDKSGFAVVVFVQRRVVSVSSSSGGGRR